MKRGLAGVALAVVLLAQTAWAEKPTNWGTPVTKTAVQSGNATDTTLWDPAADNAFVLVGCVFSASAVANVELEVSDVDVVPPIYLPSVGTVSIGFGPFPLYRSAVDAVLKYTVLQNSNIVSILCTGWEEPSGF